MNEEEFERLKAGWKQEILGPVERLNGRLNALDKRMDAFANDLRSVRHQLANLARIVSHLDEKIPKCLYGNKASHVSRLA